MVGSQLTSNEGGTIIFIFKMNKRMKKNVIVIYICFACFIICCSCRHETCHHRITINNNSNKSIYYYNGSQYPDTILTFYSQFKSGDVFSIEKFSSKDALYNGCIEGILYQFKKISFTLFDAQTIDTTPWDTVRAKYLILKRYDLSLEDLQRMNWTITYP